MIMAKDNIIYGAYHEPQFAADMFDVSPFAKNDPELAQQVSDIVMKNKIAFPGMNNISMSWAGAKNFVNGGMLYRGLIEWALAPAVRIKDVKKNFHFKELDSYFANSKTAGALLTKFNRIFAMWDYEKNHHRVNRVYYGWKAGM